MTTYITTERSVRVLEALTKIGPAFAIEVAEYLSEELPYVSTTLDNFYTKHKLAGVFLVDTKTFSRARRKYIRTDKPYAFRKPFTEEERRRRKLDRDRARAAARKESLRAESKPRLDTPSVDGARIIRLENTRHNAHDGLRHRGAVVGQSPLASVGW